LSAFGLLCCQGTIGDGADEEPAPPVASTSFELQAPVLPRLTALQYRNSLVDLLGGELPETPVEADTNPYLFFSIGAASTELSELGVQRLEEASDAVASAVFDDPERRLALLGCEPTAAADPCVSEFITRFGRRAYRRPLSSDEHQRWQSIASDLSGGDGWLAARTVVAGMLQSPHFIYRVELGTPAEGTPTDDGSRTRLTGYEMATRLSYLLWNTTPDDGLLDAAERGDLDAPEGIEAEARRLLDDPRARDAVQEFFAQYFDLGRLDGISRDPVSYPQFTPTLVESMRSEVKLLVDDFVNRRDTDVRGVFSTRRTFVNSELASLYGVDAPGATEVAFVPVELPEDGPRAGMLTLGAFLTMNAHETETSPTLRGKYVRERVLCQTVPAPPDDVDTNIPDETMEAKTLRERLEQHRNDPACASCHAFIDPPGFLFETFDSLGTFRTLDNGYPIDATGDIDGVPLANARELADLLADHELVGRCMVTQLYRHAQGRLDAEAEAGAIEQLDSQFASSGYRFRELLVALVTHEAFRYVALLEGGTP
jgi:Protein of unknown function (DUF1592)/Protein of unknown function (DUF1588)/Protein of unknown function (DUF1595)/Protein of unknown function (DUF1585)